MTNRTGKFPKATGYLRDVMDARQRGEISTEDAAGLMLEAATKRKAIESHTATHNNRPRRSMALDKDSTSREFYQYLIGRGIAPTTARQYANRLRSVQVEGIADRIREATENRDTPNRKQLLAALRLYEQFGNAE